MFRKKTIRLPLFDYSSPAAYFVTICTKNKIELFGTVEKNDTILSPIGHIARDCYVQIPEHFPSVELDAFVIMPHHIHGIIILHPVNHDVQSPPSLSTIIGSYKSAVTHLVHEQSLFREKTVWQRSFYDHIIRNDFSLHMIRRYISTNPQRWRHVRKNQFHIR
ncbi:MAG: transposase [Bacteroidota bacterium]